MKKYIDLELSVKQGSLNDKTVTSSLPTKEQIKELLDECEWVPTSVDNTEGFKIISDNGNSIFLPFPKVTFHKMIPEIELMLEDIISNMVKVEGGTFIMGTPDYNDYHHSNELSNYKVTLNDYYISKYEVTQKLWKAVMGSNPSCFKGSKLPVENVSWDDCQEFIKKLNAITGKTFRLPTEAEWEYAARGGNKSKGYKYSGSNNIDDVAWYRRNSSNKTHEVGIKAPNELGLYDMSGNVWEWCSDWYGDYSSSPQINPTGPINGSYRMLRGGGQFDHALCCRVSFRGISIPDNCSSHSGLRLVLTY